MPAQPLDHETVRALVSAATTAPSLHNAQPWRFRGLPDRRTVELRADPDRAIPRLDPEHRGLHIGCGAALFNLRVAAARAGLQARVRLLPDPDDRWFLATVHLDDTTAPPDTDLAGLFPVLERRHTSRHPFEQKPLPSEVQLVLREAADREQVQLVFPEVWHVEALLDQVRDAEGRDEMAPERFEDVRRWTRIGVRTAVVDGIPDYAFGPTRRGGRAPVRDFAGRRAVPGRPAAVFETFPNLALLGTARDRPVDWLRAGQGLERILLVATRQGLATSLTSHSLEQPDLRELARDPESAMGFVHMVLRLGYGPPGRATPRRPVDQVLEMA
ncbi:Acg family FMN-binding oxidoreductase [Streptomyces sp. MS06]|uniref:Acg family FMN-binding oxidoreductase n=1 Tax=Streptomyces sp. MS06 TaxID=3385974 RepID=UPI00399F9D3A